MGTLLFVKEREEHPERVVETFSDKQVRHGGQQFSAVLSFCQGAGRTWTSASCWTTRRWTASLPRWRADDLHA